MARKPPENVSAIVGYQIIRIKSSAFMREGERPMEDMLTLGNPAPCPPMIVNLVAGLE